MKSIKLSGKLSRKWFYFFPISFVFVFILLIFSYSDIFSFTEQSKLFSCRDILRLRNDAYFFIEGKGAWNILLGERRADIRKAKLHPVYITSKREGELYVFHGREKEGVIQFKGSFIDYIIVFLLPFEQVKKEPGIFYYSCMGFSQTDLFEAGDTVEYLKKVYNSKSYNTGKWLFFPYKGIAFLIKEKKISAFMVFKASALNKGFDYKKYFNFKIY